MIFYVFFELLHTLSRLIKKSRAKT